MGKWLRALVFVWLSLAGIHVSATPEEVSLYVYHKQPPLLINMREGLSFELAQGLNAAQGEFRFVVKVRPRNRLNAEISVWIRGGCQHDPTLACPDRRWAVLWVCPAWGWGESAAQNFAWADLMPAQNVIISNRRNMIEYNGPESLTGLRFAAISGHHVPGMEALFEQGRVRRMDGNNYQSLIWRVIRQRADVSMLMDSAFEYYLNQDKRLAERADELYVSARPFQIMMLQAMAPMSDSRVVDVINRYTHSAAWHRVLKLYEVDPKPLQALKFSTGASACELIGN